LRPEPAVHRAGINTFGHQLLLGLSHSLGIRARAGGGMLLTTGDSAERDEYRAGECNDMTHLHA
jgi:hypothetical protein